MRAFLLAAGGLVLVAATMASTHLYDDQHPRIVTHTITKTETVVDTQLSQPCKSAFDAASNLIDEQWTAYNKLVDTYNQNDHQINYWPLSESDFQARQRDTDRWTYWSGQCSS